MTENIVKFLQVNYSDEKLAALLAHAQDGKLVFASCCCFVGISTADHALQSECVSSDVPHYLAAQDLPFSYGAETEFYHLSGTCSTVDRENELRRERLIPLILAEQERRAKVKTEPDALLVAASVAQ